MSHREALHRFGIPPLAHSGLFGAFLGCHGISDALQVLHTGVGCKGKTQRHLVEHDLGKEAHTKVGWTELTEAQLIKAPLGRLGESARELCRRRQPGGIFLTASHAVEITGVDLTSAAEMLEAELGIPAFALPGLAAAPDLYAGYAAVIQAILRRVDFTQPPSPTPQAALVGTFFHRHEHEQSANLAELRRLAEGIGVSLGPTLLSGEPLATLLGAHRARAVLALPYASMSAMDLAQLTMRPTESVGLPLGLRATSRWLRALGALLGARPALVERLVSREEARARARLGPARRLLAGRSLAILADTPLAASLTLLAEELGLEVTLVALLDRSLGGESALRALVEHAGGSLPPGTEVLVGPSLLALRERGGPPDAPEHALPFRLVVRPDLGLAGTGWARIPTVEMGFPAPHKHFVYPLPELGYAGAVALGGRLLDALLGGH